MKEEMRHIRSNLRALDVDSVELASISGQKSSEWHGTDAGFALARFLDYTGSLSNSPPPSLTGTPIILASTLNGEIVGSTNSLHLREVEESYNLKGYDDTARTSMSSVDRHEISGRSRVTVSITRPGCNFYSRILGEE
jgi:hypothetical protein